MLLFERGAAIRLTVECVEASMSDLAPPANFSEGYRPFIAQLTGKTVQQLPFSSSGVKLV